MGSVERPDSAANATPVAGAAPAAAAVSTWVAESDKRVSGEKWRGAGSRNNQAACSPVGATRTFTAATTYCRSESNAVPFLVPPFFSPMPMMPTNDESSPLQPASSTSPPPALPGGFRFSGVTAGIKKSGKPDISLIVCDSPSVVAAVTTTNQIVAAPVVLCRERSPRSTFRAVITNSGNANACTGEQGMKDARAMCGRVAEAIRCDPADVLVMSTGVIGHPLPMDKVLPGIDAAVRELDRGERAFLSAADAICTTDQYRKTATASVTIGGQTYHIAAMCKGAGMIAPNMATMLAAMITDAPLAQSDADAVLREIADATFNRVSVDGHTSTNDTLILVSQAGPDAMRGAGSDSTPADPLRGGDLAAWADAAHQVCLRLSKMLVADGEGAARFFEVRVSGAASVADATTIARTVAASPLVKTAICGGDPNWGRIVSAAGYAGPRIDAARTGLAILGVPVFRDGQPVAFDAAALSGKMKASEDVLLDLCVGQGDGAASFWASDLGQDYVRFNSLYTT